MGTQLGPQATVQWVMAPCGDLAPGWCVESFTWTGLLLWVDIWGVWL